MNQILLILQVALLAVFLGYLPSTYAGTNKLSCAIKSDQRNFGGLPDFTANDDPLQGYQCQLKPYYSGFLGNWLPALPKFYLSQSNRLFTSESVSADDSSQIWNISFSLKRFGQTQLTLRAGQKKWQQVFRATKNTSFIPSDATSANAAISITTGQQTRFNHKESHLGFSLVFPYSQEQTLTELYLQKINISQAIQGNITGFEKRSLFQAEVRLDELAIASQSFHRGFNINWQFALAMGSIDLESTKHLNIESGLKQIISLNGQVELYYQYRINRRWFAYTNWQGEIRYWQQQKQQDNVSFQLASSTQIEHQLALGIGLNF